MKPRVPTPEEVESHFRSLPCTRKQMHFIDRVLLKDQYIIVDRNPQSVAAYKEKCRKEGKRYDHIHPSDDRVGHCTSCHHEWIINKSWKLKDTQKKHICPACHSNGTLVSAARGRNNKTLMRYVLFFERSKKAADVILAKGVVAVRPIEGDYKTCTTLTYPVTMYYFKLGQGAVMYKRHVHYSNQSHQFEPWWTVEWGRETTGSDGLGTQWKQQLTISELGQEYGNRGYRNEGDQQSFFEVIKNSEFRYCQAEHFFQKSSKNGLIRNYYWLKYMELYSIYPRQTELLIKRGLSCIVDMRIWNRTTFPAVNWRGKTMSTFLRFTLTKEDKKYLTKKNKEYRLPEESNYYLMRGLNVLAMTQNSRTRSGISLEEACALSNSISLDKLRNLQKDVPDLRKMMQYVKKQKTEASRHGNIYIMTNDYMDYLQEIKELEYDMKDKKNIYPRDFQKAHRRTSELIRVIRAQKRAEQIRAANSHLEEVITKRAKALQKYAMEAGLYFIRPIQSIEEMIAAGAANHNCVATYMERYAKGGSDLFVIRKKEKPDIPFFTMEICGGRIIQCRTDCNKIAAPGSDVDQFIHVFKETKLKRQERKEEDAS